MQTAAKSREEVIEVRGARTHNLKNISFSLPVNKLTVVTGVSGSGKSSLAFDTIYAEGQRRYVESLSAYARQFLERMDKPDVDEIIGIAPAIAIRQKNTTRNPRSTVATQTEIYDYLRLLFARVGQTFCHVCGREVKRDSPESGADEILETLDEETRFYVLFPVETEDFSVQRRKDAKTQKGIHIQAVLLSLMQRGFTRLFRNGEIIELQKPEDYTFGDFENTFALVDRLKSGKEIRQRLVDSLEICFHENHSAVIQTAERNASILSSSASQQDAGVPTKNVPTVLNFSERFICKYDGTIYEEPEPRLFSFNSPFGACPVCQGFGNSIDIDFDLIVPNQMVSLGDGAIAPFQRPQYDWAQKELMRFARNGEIPTDVPFADLSDWQRSAIFEGASGWRGVRGFFKWLETKKYKLHVRVFMAKYRGYTLCPECKGGRLRQAARDVRVAGKNLPEIVALSITDAVKIFDELKLSEEREQIADKLLLKSAAA